MNPQGIIQTVNTGGKEIILETGRLAKQADGSVVLKCGGTMLLATVVASKEAKDGVDFLPLTVEYKEKFAAAGRFPGGFLKRENRASDNEILVSRLIDRAIRPMFPKDYHCEIQLLISLISSDGKTMPDALACLVATAAIMVSDLPFETAISEVRVARIDGKMVVNPDLEALAQADIDMIVAATEDSILMVEGEMNFISEEEMLEAIKVAHDSIKEQCRAINALVDKVGDKAKIKRSYEPEIESEEVLKIVRENTYDACYEIARTPSAKEERSEKFKELIEEFKSKQNEEFLAENEGLINKYFYQIKKEAVRNVIISENKRLDGRKTDEIRPIWSEVDYLPFAHGSAIFTRGETQSLTTITLGSKLDEQSIDGVFLKGSDKFILHYNFPPFSTGEAKPLRGVSRREVGHGNLAMRALKPVIPTGKDNPYTIRVVSDILESNGSSSMATVCAGSLALMDAGIKIKNPVSGIAMGLIMNEDGKFAVLSDILGDEDFLGDMDFKVAGTTEGITACQMDIKIQGISFEVMKKALEQANAGRMHILNEMNKCISAPNAELKDHAPRIVQVTVPKDMIGAIIGPGGKIIQEIQAETGATITITEDGDKGLVDISAVDKTAIERAIFRIKAIAAVPEVGEIYKGKVKAIAAYGAFVEILPGKDGLLHVSEINWSRVEDVSSVLKEGDELEVKLIGVDPKSGKLKLSRKVLMPKPEAQA